MVTILISVFMFVLLVVSGLMTVIILMQKPSANAGMGAALGGGAAESVFGGEASGALLKFTVRIAVAFFLISFLLYMAIVATNRTVVSDAHLDAVLPGGAAPAAPAATSTPATAKATVPAATSNSMTTAPATTPAPKAASTPPASSAK